MPITTLQNISIPTEGANSNSSLLMPKLQYRFRVFLDNFGTTGGPDGVREDRYKMSQDQTLVLSK